MTFNAVWPQAVPLLLYSYGQRLFRNIYVPFEIHAEENWLRRSQQFIYFKSVGQCGMGPYVWFILERNRAALELADVVVICNENLAGVTFGTSKALSELISPT